MRQRGSGNVAATPDLVAERDGRVWSPDLCQITLWKISSATDRLRFWFGLTARLTNCCFRHCISIPNTRSKIFNQTLQIEYFKELSVWYAV